VNKISGSVQKMTISKKVLFKSGEKDISIIAFLQIKSPPNESEGLFNTVVSAWYWTRTLTLSFHWQNNEISIIIFWM